MQEGTEQYNTRNLGAELGLSSLPSLALNAKNCPNASHESTRRVHAEPRENSQRRLPAGDFFSLCRQKFPKINPRKASRSQTKGSTDQDKSKPFTPRALWWQRHPRSCGQTVPLGTNRGGSEVPAPPSALNLSPAPCCLHAHGHSLVGRSAVQARHGAAGLTESCGSGGGGRD